MKLTVTTFMTLDGIAQGPGGPDEDTSGGFEHGGWLVPYVDEDFGNAMSGWFAEADAFLLGRKTYEIFAGYWAKITDAEDIVATKLNSLPKYVPTHTLDQADWLGTTLLKDDVTKSVARLKEEPGRELQVHGSLNLVQTLIKADLVDEFHLLIFPVVLGNGKRLFEDIIPTGLELVKSKTSSLGAMIQTYRPIGRAVYGAFPGLE